MITTSALSMCVRCHLQIASIADPVDGRMDRSTLAIHAGRGPRVAGRAAERAARAGVELPRRRLRARGGRRRRWEAFEEAMGALEGGRARRVRERGRRRRRRSWRRCRSAPGWSAPVAGYAWTRSLLAERAASGRIVLETVDTTDTAATLGARVRAPTCCGSETPSNPLLEVCRARRAVRRAGVAGRGRLDVRDAVAAAAAGTRRGRSRCTARRSSSAGTRTCCWGWSARATTLDELRHARAQLGATPGALEAFLALRGLRTLPVRLELAQRTALTLASRLAEHPAVGAVHYPGLDRPGACAGGALHGRLRGDAVLRGARRSAAVCAARARSSRTPRASAASRA